MRTFFPHTQKSYCSVKESASALNHFPYQREPRPQNKRASELKNKTTAQPIKPKRTHTQHMAGSFGGRFEPVFMRNCINLIIDFIYMHMPAYLFTTPKRKRSRV